MTKFSGIIEHEGRKQAYTVWWKGRVMYFAFSKEEAARQLKEEETRPIVRRARR